MACWEPDVNIRELQLWHPKVQPVSRATFFTFVALHLRPQWSDVCTSFLFFCFGFSFAFRFFCSAQFDSRSLSAGCANGFQQFVFGPSSCLTVLSQCF